MVESLMIPGPIGRIWGRRSSTAAFGRRQHLPARQRSLIDRKPRSLQQYETLRERRLHFSCFSLLRGYSMNLIGSNLGWNDDLESQKWW